MNKDAQSIHEGLEISEEFFVETIQKISDLFEGEASGTVVEFVMNMKKFVLLDPKHSQIVYAFLCMVMLDKRAFVMAKLSELKSLMEKMDVEMIQEIDLPDKLEKFMDSKKERTH